MQPKSAIKDDNKNGGKPWMTQAANCHGAFVVSFHLTPAPESIQQRLENHSGFNKFECSLKAQ